VTADPSAAFPGGLETSGAFPKGALTPALVTAAYLILAAVRGAVHGTSVTGGPRLTPRLTDDPMDGGRPAGGLAPLGEVFAGPVTLANTR